MFRRYCRGKRGKDLYDEMESDSLFARMNGTKAGSVRVCFARISVSLNMRNWNITAEMEKILFPDILLLGFSVIF